MLVFVFFLYQPVPTMAEGNPYAVGARSWGLANAVVARYDPMAFSGNIAGIAGTGGAQFFSGVDTYYGFDGLNTLSFGGVIPYSKDLAVGFSVLRFGDKLYNESNISLGAGHQIDRISIGLKVNYLQTSVNIPSYMANHGALVFEMGGIVQLSSKLFLGAHAFNLFRAKYSGEYRTEVPTVLKVGLQFEPIKLLKLSVELNKNTDLPISVLMGAEYQFYKNVFLRAGLIGKPLSNHFGVGFVAKKLLFDYALHTNQSLGMSHHLSVGIRFVKQKESIPETGL